MDDNYYFVLVGQPVNDLYPSWMEKNQNITYIQMPALDLLLNPQCFLFLQIYVRICHLCPLLSF